MTQISLEKFLTQTTSIPIKFIKNHLKFYAMCEKNLFGITLGSVIEYLNVTEKEKFIKRFKKKFTEGVDYQVSITKRYNQKGVENKIYNMTLDTFEKICMLTNAKIGDNVREYFIILRKFIQYYKNNISEMIINSNCVIYVILVNKGTNLYKIGRTCDLRKRLSTYSTGKELHPDIKFVMQVNDPKKLKNVLS
jgi:phage anti-repressor protein